MAKRRQTKPSKPKSNTPWILLAIGGALLCVGAFYFLNSSKNSDEDVVAEGASRVELSKIKAVKVFVENSGSMDGYVRAVNSQLKSDLNALVSGISILKNPSASGSLVDTIELNYINSELIPIRSSISRFTESLSVSAFKEYGGSRASTSLQDLLERVQQATGSQDVSILVSDMILDLASGQSAESVSTNIETTLRRHLMNRQDWAIAVWRMLSDFDGKYYEVGTVADFKGKRPYYIIMMGNRAQLYSILSKGQLPDNLSFYKNRTHQMTLEPASNTPKYSINPNAISGSIMLDRSDKYTIREAKSGKLPSGERLLSFELKMSLPQVLQNESRLLDANAYDVSPNSYHLSKVRRGNDGAIYLRLESPDVVLGDVMVSLKQAMPQWIGSVHAEENTDILNPEKRNQTYGIKYILEGLRRPYESTAAKLFTLKIRLKK